MGKTLESRSIYKKLDTEAKQIVALYHQYRVRACFDVVPKENDINRFSEEDVDYLPSVANKDKYTRFVYAVDAAMKALAKPHQLIIFNEYFNKDYNFWWLSYYSRSSFYRIKRLALEEFISFFR